MNTITTKAGTVRPVCEYCGRQGRAVAPDAVSERGHIDLFSLGRGWAVAPYPPDFQHRDGSTGDLFTCPECRRRGERGEGLRSRAYLEAIAADERQAIQRSDERARAAYCARHTHCPDWPLCGHDAASEGDAVD